MEPEGACAARSSAGPALLEEVDRVSTVSTSTRGTGAGRMAWDG